MFFLLKVRIKAVAAGTLQRLEMLRAYRFAPYEFERHGSENTPQLQYYFGTQSYCYPTLVSPLDRQAVH